MRVYNLRHVAENHFSFLFCLGAHIFSIRQGNMAVRQCWLQFSLRFRSFYTHTHTRKQTATMCPCSKTRRMGGKSGSNCGPTLLSFPCTANFLVIFSICVASLNTHNLYIYIVDARFWAALQPQVDNGDKSVSWDYNKYKLSCSGSIKYSQCNATLPHFTPAHTVTP